MAVILYGHICDHTKKTDHDGELRIYASDNESVKKGDVFSVWYSGRLAHFRADEVKSPYLCKQEDFGYKSVEEVPYVLGIVDVDNYKLQKAYNKKLYELKAIQAARLAEAKQKVELDKLIKDHATVSPELKAVTADIKKLMEDPKSALVDEE